ncbi:hypothetical protein D9M68_740230 [compost metagenome]
MPVFSIYAHEVLVGYSNLEFGDPPMGVAFGIFRPTPGYSTIRSECISNRADQAHLALTVRTEGQTVLTCAGVGIMDCDDGPGSIEVNVLGISCPAYETLFPEHVAAYERQWT